MVTNCDTGIHIVSRVQHLTQNEGQISCHDLLRLLNSLNLGGQRQHCASLSLPFDKILNKKCKISYGVWCAERGAE